MAEFAGEHKALDDRAGGGFEYFRAVGADQIIAFPAQVEKRYVSSYSGVIPSGGKHYFYAGVFGGDDGPAVVFADVQAGIKQGVVEVESDEVDFHGH